MQFTKGQKLLATGATVVAAATVIGVGTYADWTKSVTSASESVTAGTLNVTLDADGTGNRIDVAATNLAPGDTISRLVNVNNAGNLDWSKLELTTAATGDTTYLFGTGTGTGASLALKAERCVGGSWTEGGTSPAYTYTCGSGGTLTTVFNSASSVITTPLDLGASPALTHGGVDPIVFTLTLPSSNTDLTDFGGKTGSLAYTFKATQRTASAH